MGRRRYRSVVPLAVVAVALAAGVAMATNAGVNAAAEADNAAAEADIDLTARIGELVGAQSSAQPYRDPSPAERVIASVAFGGLLTGDPGGFAPLGFTAVDGVDRATGRPFTLVANGPGDRAWGILVLDRAAPLRYAVQVPHPLADIDTESIGLDLFRRVPGSILMIAGAHRRAAGDRADVAHNEGSLYQVLSIGLADRGIPQVQVHGFADASLPGTDAVVSTGTRTANGLAERTASHLTGGRFVTCVAWAQRCGQLAATTNVQGRAATARGTVFVHVELNNGVRTDPARRLVAVRALAAAV
jgi:hypothetical protein